MRFSTNKIIFGLSAIGLFLYAEKCTFANTIFTFVQATPNDATVNISGDGGVTYENGYAGTYQGSINGKTFNVYCTDFHHNVSNGQSFLVNTDYKATDSAGSLSSNGFYTGGTASAMNSSDYKIKVNSVTTAQRASRIAWLTDNYQYAANSAFASGLSGSKDFYKNQAAINCSIWDIVQDGGDGITNGSLILDSSGQSTYGGLVSYFEALAAQHDGYVSNTVSWIQSQRDANYAHYQDFLTSSPVPEPGVTATLISLGLAAGFLGIRKKSKKDLIR